MNLKLNVVRLANEDVIATSGLCAHLDADRPGNDMDHIYVLGPSSSPGWYSVTTYAHGATLTDSGNVSLSNAWFATTPEYNTWYYYTSDNYGQYVKCEEQEDLAHPLSTK